MVIRTGKARSNDFARAVACLAGLSLLCGAIGCGGTAPGAPPMPPVAAPGRSTSVTPATLSSALAAARPGDVLVLADGQYSAPDASVRIFAVESTAPGGYAVITAMRPGAIAIPCSGTPGNPITIRAAGRAAVFKGTVDLSSRAYVILDGLRVKGAYTYGILARTGDHLEIRNCVVADVDARYGIFLDNVNATLIEGNEICRTESHGISVFGNSHDVTVRGNRVHDCPGCGIYFDAYTNPGRRLSNILVENNTISHTGTTDGAALNISNVVDSVFRNNLLYKNEAGGICFYQAELLSPAPFTPPPAGFASNAKTALERIVAFFFRRPDNCARNKVVSNTVYFEPGHGRWCLRMCDKAPNFYVHNNVFFGGQHGAVSVGPLSLAGLSMDDNMVGAYPGGLLLGESFPDDGKKSFSYSVDQWRAKGFDRHSILAVDPLFVSIAKDDYRLSPNSPAIDAGADLKELCPMDLDAVMRPQGKAFDCGAYEYAPGASGPGGSSR